METTNNELPLETQRFFNELSSISVVNFIFMEVFKDSIISRTIVTLTLIYFLTIQQVPFVNLKHF